MMVLGAASIVTTPGAADCATHAGSVINGEHTYYDNYDRSKGGFSHL
jgi:hypothetical protein